MPKWNLRRWCAGTESQFSRGLPTREKLHAGGATGAFNMSAASKAIKIVPAASISEIEAARQLIHEYGVSLGIDLSFQNFEAELEKLPGDYAPPRGALLLARQAKNFIGCIGLRPLADGVCEMKRLYVRPQWRGQGIGQRLIEAVLAAACRRGYRAMRLDTLPSMTAARALYQSLGFRPIAPYYESPIAGTAFFELDLTAGQSE